MSAGLSKASENLNRAKRARMDDKAPSNPKLMDEIAMIRRDVAALRQEVGALQGMIQLLMPSKAPLTPTVATPNGIATVLTSPMSNTALPCLMPSSSQGSA